VLRERLKEAKGIGTPATRAEIIGGLKKQAFLIAQGKNIVPTETGLSLFGVLKQADPSLVDPGLTAQLECLLDEVVIGKQGCGVRRRSTNYRQAAGRRRRRRTAVARRRHRRRCGITPTNASDETLC
jgi:DNA topoisomerase IA